MEDQLVHGTPASEFRPNSNGESEESRGLKGCSGQSVSRTKTVSFSQNGYSEEVLKLSNYGKPLGTELEQPPPGFEHTGINEYFMGTGCVLKTMEYGASPLEEGEFRTQFPDESEAPLGFEKKVPNVDDGEGPQVSLNDDVPPPNSIIVGLGNDINLHQASVNKRNCSIGLGEATSQRGARVSNGHQTEEETPPGFIQSTDGQGADSLACATPSLLNRGADPPIQQHIEDPSTTMPEEVLILRRQSCTVTNRVTRSQARRSKVQVDRSRKELDEMVSEDNSQDRRPHKTNSNCILNNNVSGVGVRGGSPSGSESTRTTDSIAKIAKEALEVGELLAIKVIAHKENAMKRITKSLKSQRSTRSTHKGN